MPTSESLLRQVRRAYVAVFVLGCFINALLLVVPLYALHVFESVVASASIETLVLITGVAGAALLTLISLEAVRDRVLLRAGLWLDHTMGAHILENGIRLGLSPVELKQNADALALYKDTLVERGMIPALDAPWAPIFLVALVLINPTLGGVAALCALALLLAMLLQAASTRRLSDQADRAAARTRSWWLGQLTHLPGLSVGAGEQWERLNRAGVAGAYQLGKRTSLHRNLARLLMAGSHLAVMAVGAWLVIDQSLSSAVLFAGILINIRLLAQIEGLIGSLGTLRRARAAYHQLEALPVAADTPRASLSNAGADPDDRPARATAMPRLHLRGPLALASAIIVLFFGVGLGAAAYAPLDRIASLANASIFESRLLAVRPLNGGIGARIHVAEGAEVRAGDLLITLDTTALDRQIAQLRSRAEAANRQLAVVGRQTAELVGLPEPAPADQLTLLALEQHIIQLKMEAEQLFARIAVAEQDLARSEIRAPVSGRVVSLAARGPNPVIAPGATVLEIATAADRSLLDRLIDPMRRTVHRAFGT